VLRALENGPCTVRTLAREVPDVAPTRRREILASLVADGLVSRTANTYALSE
jgi:DNA-binding HxlR family transcriptional regulator